MSAPNKAQPFSIRCRVYFEDTDAGGVVYHANYLRFMERARTEWLRQQGLVQSSLALGEGILFVVRACTVRYHAPARLDDELLVSAVVTGLRRASLVFEQQVHRVASGQLLCSGQVQVACVDPALKPRSIPDVLRKALCDPDPSSAGE